MDNETGHPASQRADRTEIARGSAAVAVIFCGMAWLLFFSGVTTELGGATDHSYRDSYVFGGVVGVAGTIATAVAGRLGTPTIRTWAGSTFVLLLMPTWWGLQMIVAIMQS